MTHSTVLKSLALGVLITSGCQSTLPLHAMRQPVFAMGQHGEPAGVAIATRPNATVGGLTVSFQRELAQWTRRVLATVGDVEKVIVTVKPTGAADVSQTVLKAAIANGQTSVSFQSLPPGVATVTITAFDATDASIGTVTRSTTVTAGQTATVDVTLQLAPTIVSGSSGGGSTPTTGGIATNVTIQDGPVVTPLPGGGVLEKHTLPFQPYEIAGNGGDAFWVTGASGQTPVLAKLSTTGAIECLVTDVAGLVGPLCVDADGDAWVMVSNEAGQSVMAEYNGAGTKLSQVPLSQDFMTHFGPHMQMDSDRNIYAIGAPHMGGARQAPDGTFNPILTSGTTLRPGTLDDLWVGVFTDPAVDMEKTTSFVVRYSKAGVELGRYSVGAGYRSAYTAIDQQGNAWVTAMRSDFSPGAPSLKGRLVKFSPHGQQLGVFDLSNGEFANDVEIGSDGKVWVASNDAAGTNTVTWFDMTGAELGCASIPDSINPWQIVATRRGAWVIQYSGDASTKRGLYRIAPDE
jgi:hypothetical protein